MDDQFKAISLSYKNAPIEIRELIALDENACGKLLGRFSECLGISEGLILSTCNRTEVYYSSSEDRFEDILRLIGVEKNVAGIDRYRDYFVRYERSDAIRHLFNVSAGLEAQVVGDLQISNQVKRAYQLSADLNLAGPFLHRLMHTVFFTNKRIVQETSFRDGAASVSYAAIELVEEFSARIVNPNIMVIGVGEVGKDVCKILADLRYKNVSITNRSEEKARAAAEICGYKFVPFADVHDAIGKSDVIISSVAGDKFAITQEFVKSLEIPGYKYFIDLGVPRCVEQAIETIPGVLVYNIDNIKNKTSEALEKRISAIPHVKTILAESVEELKSWTREMGASPIIKKFKNALEQIRKEEMARYLKDLDGAETDKIDKITKSILQKIIKMPVLQLKAACKRGDAENLIEGLNELFNLEKERESKTR